jgi:hypothetical protein
MVTIGVEFVKVHEVQVNVPLIDAMISYIIIALHCLSSVNVIIDGTLVVVKVAVLFWYLPKTKDLVSHLFDNRVPKLLKYTTIPFVCGVMCC